MAGGAADLDGRLQIDDEISHINGNSVINASLREVMGDAAAQGDVVLGIRRKMPMFESGSWDDDLNYISPQISPAVSDIAG